MKALAIKIEFWSKQPGGSPLGVNIWIHFAHSEGLPVSDFGNFDVMRIHPTPHTSRGEQLSQARALAAMLGLKLQVVDSGIFDGEPAQSHEANSLEPAPKEMPI